MRTLKQFFIIAFLFPVALTACQTDKLMAAQGSYTLAVEGLTSLVNTGQISKAYAREKFDPVVDAAYVALKTAERLRKAGASENAFLLQLDLVRDAVADLNTVWLEHRR